MNYCSPMILLPTTKATMLDTILCLSPVAVSSILPLSCTSLKNNGKFIGKVKLAVETTRKNSRKQEIITCVLLNLIRLCNFQQSQQNNRWAYSGHNDWVRQVWVHNQCLSVGLNRLIKFHYLISREIPSSSAPEIMKASRIRLTTRFWFNLSSITKLRMSLISLTAKDTLLYNHFQYLLCAYVLAYCLCMQSRTHGMVECTALMMPTRQPVFTFTFFPVAAPRSSSSYHNHFTASFSSTVAAFYHHQMVVFRHTR